MSLRLSGVRDGRPGSGDAGLKAAANAFDPHILVALTAKELLGSLIMNVTFPAFALTRSLYKRDLYVKRRRHGMGQALVRAAARLALSEGFSALEWTTGSENTAARMMYEACGARLMDRVYYRLFADALKSAAH
jgi:GNAT superfamily N-acetyltransferase